jgi:hypothetical protein
MLETIRVIESLKGGVGLRADGRGRETGPGFYSCDDITFSIEFYPAKGYLITPVTECVPFHLVFNP